MASAYQTRILADGASNYWPLDDPSGTVARDLAGTAPGTISGGVTLNQPGVGAGKSMTFDGVDDIVTGPAIGSRGSNVTLEAWMRFDVVVIGLHRYPVQIGTIATNMLGFAYFADASQTGVMAVSSGGGADTGGVAAPSSGAWHHHVAVYNSSTTRATYFIDGIVKADIVWAIGTFNFTAPFIFGGSGGNRYVGSLQDIAIYPRALTPTEIAAHNVAGRSAPADFSDGSDEDFPMLECNHASVVKTQSGTVVGSAVYLPASCRNVSVQIDSEGSGAGSFQLESAGTLEFAGTWTAVGSPTAAVPGGSISAQFPGSYMALRLRGTGVTTGCTARIIGVT